MAKFKIAHDYTSSVGSFDKGAVVDIDPEFAEYLERDSPGLLKPVKGKAAAEPSTDEGQDEAESIDDQAEAEEPEEAPEEAPPAKRGRR